MTTRKEHMKDSEIDVDEIEVGKRMREPDAGVIDELAKDMARHGLLQRIGVRRKSEGSGFDLLWGRNRLEAARKLEWPTILAVVYPPYTTDEEAEELEIVENLLRKDLTAKQKEDQTLRLGILIRRQEEVAQQTESLGGPDFSEPKPDKPMRRTGRGNKGTIQKIAEREGVNQATVRDRLKKGGERIGEPINIETDSLPELERKLDKSKQTPAPEKPMRRTKTGTTKKPDPKPEPEAEAEAKPTPEPEPVQLPEGKDLLLFNLAGVAEQAMKGGCTRKEIFEVVRAALKRVEGERSS
jgi:hypothetical protein